MLASATPTYEPIGDNPLLDASQRSEVNQRNRRRKRTGVHPA